MKDILSSSKECPLPPSKKSPISGFSNVPTSDDSRSSDMSFDPESVQIPTAKFIVSTECLTDNSSDDNFDDSVKGNDFEAEGKLLEEMLSFTTQVTIPPEPRWDLNLSSESEEDTKLSSNA